MLPLLVGLAAGTLVSEDLTSLSAGMLVASGHLPFATALAACLLGIVVGDALMYAVGRWLGRPFLRKRPLSLLVQEETVERAAAWLRRNAFLALVASRVLPGARMPTFVALGLAGTADRRVASWYALMTLVWTPVLVAAGAWGGAYLLKAVDASGAGRIWLFLVPLAAVWAVGRAGAAIVRRRTAAQAGLPPAHPGDADSPR
jgi:membrane protein DedA with SNARE-associated domain